MTTEQIPWLWRAGHQQWKVRAACFLITASCNVGSQRYRVSRFRELKRKMQALSKNVQFCETVYRIKRYFTFRASLVRLCSCFISFLWHKRPLGTGCEYVFTFSFSVIMMNHCPSTVSICQIANLSFQHQIHVNFSTRRMTNLQNKEKQRKPHN